MSLLLVDMAAAMNFLSDQAGDNHFSVLETRSFDKSIKRKPLPMLPIQKIPRRKPIVTDVRPLSIPNPEPATENPNETQKLPLYSSTASYHDESIYRSNSDGPPLSPADSHLTRSSSVYSTDTISSTDSVETTISGIVAMYTDLINKISWDELPSDVQLLQPQVYRDTVAPLMQRRFSDDMKAHTFTPPMSPVSALRTSKMPLETSSKSSPPKGLGIQNISHYQSSEGFEFGSPVSPETFNLGNQGSHNAVSEPSPIISPIRPFSWSRDEIETNLESIVHEAPHPSQPSQPTQSQWSCDSQGMKESLHHSQPDTYHSDLEKSLRYIRSPDMFDVQSHSQQKTPLSHHSSPVQYETASFHHRNTPSVPTDDFVVRSGVGETVKSVVKEKINRRREEKEMADILATASLKYPGMQQDPKRLSQEQRRSSFKDGMDTLARKLSITGSTDHQIPSHQPPRRQRTPAISLTPYQKYGADIWLANNKKLKKKHSRERETRKSEEIIPRPQQDHTSGHRRTASARTHDTMHSPSSQKKINFMAALEGAKHSLTNTSAEKRREKLKGSIVVIGPAVNGGRH